MTSISMSDQRSARPEPERHHYRCHGHTRFPGFAAARTHQFGGVVFLWLSGVWTTRQKIIGTLFVPGGLLTPLLLVNMVYPSTQSPSVLSKALSFALLFVMVVGPIATSVYLGRALALARRG